MALNANALVTVDEFLTMTGGSLFPTELLSVFRDATGSPASATVEVTATKVTIDSNIEAATDLLFVNYSTITLLVSAINAVTGWTAVALKPNATPSDLEVAASQGCFEAANTVRLEGGDRSAVEWAINSASNQIETWCARTFRDLTYKRLYNGGGQKDLVLGVQPVTSITRVAVGRQDAMAAKYTGVDAQDATVEIDTTGVNLVVQGGADDGTDTITFANEATMTEMVAAINALTNWTAELLNSVAGTWATVDLLEFSPRNSLRQNVGMFVPSDSVDDYDLQGELGFLTLRGTANLLFGTQWGVGSGLGVGVGAMPIYPLGADKLPPLWPPGNHNIYVKFQGGFATIPPDVQDACVEMANNMMGAKCRDTGLASETVDGYARSEGGGPFNQSIRDRLYPYRNVVLTFSWVDV